ncbi:hypothetical protein H8A95_03355 [Bradyrhizobium sp. Pear76]|nr:hypothetical protein [Bradyrhizobium oropedii]
MPVSTRRTPKQRMSGKESLPLQYLAYFDREQQLRRWIGSVEAVFILDCPSRRCGYACLRAHRGLINVRHQLMQTDDPMMTAS